MLASTVPLINRPHSFFLHLCSEPSQNWHLTVEHLMAFGFLRDLSAHFKNRPHFGMHKVDSSTGFVTFVQLPFHSWHPWHAHVQHFSGHGCFVTFVHAQYGGQFPSSSKMLSSMISSSVNSPRSSSTSASKLRSPFPCALTFASFCLLCSREAPFV